VERSIWEGRETVPKGRKGRVVDMTSSLADAFATKIVRSWLSRARRARGDGRDPVRSAKAKLAAALAFRCNGSRSWRFLACGDPSPVLFVPGGALTELVARLLLDDDRLGHRFGAAASPDRISAITSLAGRPRLRPARTLSTRRWISSAHALSTS
jgi:hypothetical protein